MVAHELIINYSITLEISERKLRMRKKEKMLGVMVRGRKGLEEQKGGQNEWGREHLDLKTEREAQQARVQI